MYLKIIAIFLFNSSLLSAYELPKIESLENNQPKITMFEAVSVLIDEKLSYIIKWSSVNATDANITFFDKVPLSGNVTITEDEYNRGTISLHVSNSLSAKSARKTINDQKEGSNISPEMLRDETKNNHYYNTVPRMRAPYRRYPYRRPYYR